MASTAVPAALARLLAPTRGYAVACAAAVTLTAAFAGCLVAGVPGVPAAAPGLAALAAAAGCAARARRTGSGPTSTGRTSTGTGTGRTSWALLGLAALSWAGGRLGAVWLAPAGDTGFAALVALTVAGLAVVPVPARNVASRARAVLDGLIIACALVDAHASGALSGLGWFAGFMVVLLAASRPSVDGRRLRVLLPYFAVAAVLATSVLDLVRAGHVDGFGYWTRSLIIFLVVGRQVLTLLQNRSLTRNLEARVLARTTELQASEQRFRALVQHSSDVVTVVDADADVLYQSESLTRVFGYPAATLAGRSVTALLDDDSALRLRLALHQLAQQPYGTTVLELTVRHHDGHARDAEMTITNLLDDANVRGLVLNTRDVSEHKRLKAQLVHEAFHDGLTRLANRALFKDRVDLGIRRRPSDGEPDATLAVLFLDLDGFKEVNDSLGHAAGDQLLVQVADRLRASVRPGDTVARFGGDEFAVLVESVTTGADAEHVATRIGEGLRDTFLIDNHEIHVRASIGIAMAGPDAADSDQLMRNADLAMYRAKAAGEGGFARYDPQMHSGLVERLQLEADLRRALEAGEFELNYQPTIELTSGELIGFEALLRWRHPSRGLIPPVEFVPLAEATGLIRPIGAWVLLQACRQAMAWNYTDPRRPLTLSVNVSGRQFERADLAMVVAAALAETGLPAERLCLEMTESVLMNDTEENLAQLVRLKNLGVRLAIDDFGTGYSSLSYLRRFPVDTLKIDRSFVERLADQSDDAALARTIVQLGQSLGMSTVAEGIEQYTQLQALRRMGCELGQGYYFDRPLSAAEAGRLLTTGSVAA
jgi:diguanylate cyclase (GGDEF)-like protein/PAS domain S-box-containing protein